MNLFGFASAIQLVPDGTLLFHLALIVLMVSLLNRTLLKPVNKALQERERRTRGRSREAQSVLASVDKRVGEYEHQLRKARAAGYALLEHIRSAAAKERDRKVSQVKSEVIGWRDDEKTRLKRAEVDAQAELMMDAKVRATEISNRILGR